ncbi:MAG: hypothetical protein RLZZ436_2204, partial [Planctomycetota bacterium]
PCGSSVAEAPGCVLHPGARPCPRRQQRVARSLYPRAAALRLKRGGSPRLRFASGCPALPAASAARSQEPLPAGSRPAAHVWRQPPVVFRTLVRAGCVGAAFAGLFTRGLPPCGSLRCPSLLTSHFSLLTSHFRATPLFSSPLSTLYSLAQRPLPAGCRQAAQRASSLLASTLPSPLNYPRSPLSRSVPRAAALRLNCANISRGL